MYIVTEKMTVLGITKIGKLGGSGFGRHGRPMRLCPIPTMGTLLYSASHSICRLGNISTGIIVDAVCFACFKCNCVHFCRLIVR